MTQLGIVTYNIAKDWDLATILSRLEKLGYEGVELRTSHAHKVEVNLTKAQRDEVRKRFEDSAVQLAGLGSAFEYQAADPAVVRKNIEGTKEYVRLAHDIGSPGVKVRPNGIPRGADLDATLRQIGRALHEIGEDADRLRHRDPRRGPRRRHAGAEELRQDPQYADHPNVYACWNSNPTDVENGSVKATFALVASRIREVHLRDLTDDTYPWRELFALLAAQHYEGFTLAEIPESTDPERVLRYFKALWLSYQPGQRVAEPGKPTFPPRREPRALPPGQGRIGRFQWIIGLIPQVPGTVRRGSCIIRSDCSADILRAFLTAVFTKICFAFLASESSSTIVIERAGFFHLPAARPSVASGLERVGRGDES